VIRGDERTSSRYPNPSSDSDSGVTESLKKRGSVKIVQIINVKVNISTAIA
jgi:hypothetical protein